MEDFCFIITAYKQLRLTEQNVLNIRNNYNHLNSCPIIIVSTSEEDIGFDSISEKHDNIYVIKFFDAPGSLKNSWYNFKPHEYNCWRGNFLPPRILMSIEKALVLARSLGMKKALHLHSDTMWDANREDFLLEAIEKLDNYTLMGDAHSRDDGDPLYVHPEGLFFNIEKCYDCGYGFTFSSIFKDDSAFKIDNYHGTEASVALYLAWCLTGKNIYITKKNKHLIPDEYKKEFSINLYRGWHGAFPHGMINLPQEQPDGL